MSQTRTNSEAAINDDLAARLWGSRRSAPADSLESLTHEQNGAIKQGENAGPNFIDFDRWADDGGFVPVTIGT